MNSKLFFVPSHHDFDKEGVQATPEMLDHNLWALVNSNGEKVDPNVLKIYKDAFNGLSQIHPFWAKVSMEIDLNKKCFLFPKRVWAQIYHGENCIIHLSHHTQYDNAAFNGLTEWPEIVNYQSSPNYQGADLEFKKLMNWSSIQNWEKFFKIRISKFGQDLLKECSALITEVDNKIRTGQNILYALYETENNRNPE